MRKLRILAINPGSTSTKIAIYDGMEPVKEISLTHSSESLKGYASIIDQFDFRKQAVMDALKDAGIELGSIEGIIGRGGLVKPIKSGVYEVNDALRRDLRGDKRGQHASNLGGLIADSIAKQIGVRAFIADPVVVDELQDVARISGLPQLERVSIFHALNQKAIAREYAASIGKKYEDMNLIVAHLGGGISVGAHRRGEVVDVNNALDGDGPFSAERAGTLPAGALVNMCFSGEYTLPQIKKMLCGQGGVVAHLQTNDMREVNRIVEAGGEKGKKALLIRKAMCYNVAKWIGSMSTVLKGRVDAIILTGGIAHGVEVCTDIKDMVSFIGPVEFRPGENELQALVSNAIMALNGTVEVKIYK